MENQLWTRVWILLSVVVLTAAHLTMPDYRHHPCRRDCLDGGALMTCEYNFTVEWYHTLSKACYDCPFNLTDCARPHCVSTDGFYRSVATVNRMLPGPQIQVCHDDMIVVRLYNRLETAETTSIHWHGIHQKNYQCMDGVAMLTQCPVNQHAIFTYKFLASPAGTHYWHAHAGLQRGDGVFGALIVRQKPSTEPHNSSALYDHDLAEHVLIVNDWMHELSVQKFSSHHHAGDDNKAKSMLINGLGAKIEVIHPDDSSTKAFTPRAKFTVQQGKRYRFRLISNAILNCPIQISVENHPLLLIASDGSPIEPYSSQNLVIYGGERYDFVLHANQTSGNYWLRAAGLADCSDTHYGAAQAAVIHYSGAPDEPPAGATDYASMKQAGKVVNPFNTPASDDDIPVSLLRSLPDLQPDPALRDQPDYKFFFGMDFMKIDNLHFNHPELYPLRAIRRGMHLYSPQMNNISNTFPPSPALTQLHDVNANAFCSHALLAEPTQDCPGGCSCLHRYNIDLGSVVEVIVVDEGVTFDASHPMHLHGYSFRVVGMDKISTEVNIQEVKALDNAGLLERNLKNPPSKDTVIVPDGGYVILRFYADNPGEWFFHCHLLFHSELGMGLVFSVGEKADLPPVPLHFPRCGSYDGGNTYSQETSSASRIGMIPAITIFYILFLLCKYMIRG